MMQQLKISQSIICDCHHASSALRVIYNMGICKQYSYLSFVKHNCIKYFSTDERHI